jgi:hypothetical protein
MSRTKLIRQIYFELHSALGARASRQEILRCAVEIVRLHRGERVEPRPNFRTGGIPFSMWSLDRAFADGGWRVLSYERNYAYEMEEEESLGYNTISRLRRGII